MRTGFITTALLAVGVATAAATSLMRAYLDDRSNAEAVLRSYYNALIRKEYARAWSYYGDEKPYEDFGSFETASMTIADVDLAVGNVESEGAAGSVFHTVPVAVRITREDGSIEVVAGCLVVRLANPQIQGVPFRPMHIVSSALAPADEPLEDAVPDECPES